jgi:TRAP-type C4-dicarboxylate transport system permease small subunit
MVRRLAVAADAALATAFAVMFMLFALQVAGRYLWSGSLLWSEEVIRILYIWIIFVSVATSIRWQSHVSIDFAVTAAGDRTRRAFLLVAHGAVLVAFLWMLPGTLDYLAFMVRIPTGVLELPTGLVFACFAIFNIGVPIKLAFEIRDLLRPDRGMGVEER